MIRRDEHCQDDADKMSSMRLIGKMKLVPRHMAQIQGLNRTFTTAKMEHHFPLYPFLLEGFPLTPDSLIRFVSIGYRTAQYLARNIRKPLRTHCTDNTSHIVFGQSESRTIQRHGLVIPPTATCQPDLNQRLLLACQRDSYLSRFCHDTCGVRTADKRTNREWTEYPP